MFPLLQTEIASTLLATLSTVNSTRIALPFLMISVPLLFMVLGIAFENRTGRSAKRP